MFVGPRRRENKGFGRLSMPLMYHIFSFLPHGMKVPVGLTGDKASLLEVHVRGVGLAPLWFVLISAHISEFYTISGMKNVGFLCRSAYMMWR